MGGDIVCVLGTSRGGGDVVNGGDGAVVADDGIGNIMALVVIALLLLCSRYCHHCCRCIA